MVRPIFGQMSTDIAETEFVSGILIYPNPANDILNIEGADSDCRVSVYSLTGQALIRESGNCINVSILQSGIYLIKIESGDQSALLKFVKQ